MAVSWERDCRGSAETHGVDDAVSFTVGRVSGVVARNVRLDEVTTPIQIYQTNLGHP